MPDASTPPVDTRATERDEAFAPWNGAGRCFTRDDVIALGDADAAGRVRLDGVARLLQSISFRDSEDAGFVAPWVLRRLALRFDGTPRYGDAVELSTWCSGSGGSIAERRTTIAVTTARGGTGPDPGARVEARALWVHVDMGRGVPAPLPEEFDAVYGPSAAGRRVRGRLSLPAPAADAAGTPWPLRAVDVDPVGHVHNVAFWAPIEEARRAAWGNRPIARAELEFRGAIDRDDAVELVTDLAEIPNGQLRAWLRVDGDVRAAAVLTGRG